MKGEDIEAMVSDARRIIKERAHKKKEEEKVNDESSSHNLTLDGKPEEFRFKNIKPKKAFLLMGNSSTEESAAEKVPPNIAGPQIKSDQAMKAKD